YAYFCGVFVPVLNGFSDSTTIKNGSLINANCRKFMSNMSVTKESTFTKYTKAVNNGTTSYSLSNGSYYSMNTSNQGDSDTVHLQMNNVGDNTSVSCDISTSYTYSLSLTTTSAGALSIAIDQFGKMTYDNSQVTNTSVISLTDTISSNGKLVVNCVNGSSSTMITLTANSTTISMNITIKDGTKTMTTTATTKKNYVDLNTSLTGEFTQGLRIDNTNSNSKYIRKREGVKVNLPPLYDNVTLRYNSSTKTWAYYGFGDYSKVDEYGVFYSY
ncbi:MAG: hypothetical protein SPI99_02205, partial [Candidatus Enterosoma sp.]|nr:hypothetical protein [Candidatus Enterosoma sp.]